MLKLLVRQLAQLVPVLFLVSLATFFMLDLIPGDPAASIVGQDATPQELERVRSELGLDKPVLERYVDWAGGVLQGDFGKTIIPPAENVGDLIAQRLPVTLQITLMAMVFALVLAIPLGMASAYLAGGRFDGAVSGTMLAIVSIPSFLIALFLVFALIFHQSIIKSVLLVGGVLLFGWLVARLRTRWAQYGTTAGRRRELLISLGALAIVAAVTFVLVKWFPTFPRQGFVRITDDRGLRANLKSAFLPALTLAMTELAVFSRLLRGDMLATLKEDFVLAARSRGMPPWRVLVFDALRPSSFSLLTVAGVSLGRLVGGAVLIESIFSLPGLGTLMIESINTQDFPVVQAGVLIIAVLYVLLNTAVDITYGWLDPRVRHGNG